MSQVRKYEQGGAASSQQTQTSTPKTYGKFIMNGQEEQVTDDLINQFSSWLSSQDRDVQTSLAPIRKKLQAGEDINFDSHAQELSDNSGLPLKNDRQDRRMRRQRSGAGMLFDALTNNNVHKNAVAMEALSGFRYNKPAPPAPPKPTKVNFSERVLDYNTSEDGKTRTYSANPTNAAAWGNVDKWFDYLDMDEEGRKGYEYGGFQGMSLQEMLDYGPDRATVMAAKQRIIADQATQDDWDIINRFNIWDPKSKSQPAAPQTPEDKKKAADQTIADHGLDIEQANQFGIGLNEDMSLDLSRLANDRVHIFGDYGPITKGKYYGGAYYNGKLYTKDEAEKDETLLKLLAPYREQIAKGNYNDTSSVNYWWGRDPAYRTYNPQSNFYGEFGDHLGIKDENGQVKSQSNPFMWLNNTHSLGEGESLIAVPDFESGTNPLTGMANKMKYLHYNPQTGVSVNYENMWGQRAEALQGDLVLPEWGNRYKNMQRYAPLFSRSNMNFAIGENDNRLYYEEDGDYYLVRDFDVYNKIKQGGHNVSRDDIDRLKRGTKSHGGVRAGKILLSEDKWWSAEDPKAQGYRFKAGDSRWSGDWVQFLQGLDSDRTKVLGTQKYQYGGSLRNVQGGRVQSTNQGTQLKDDVRIADTSAPKVIGDGQGLTSNDKLELAAMAADLAGLGLSFVPGYGNIAGAAAGVAGTGMQFAADVGRDGLD